MCIFVLIKLLIMPVISLLQNSGLGIFNILFSRDIYDLFVLIQFLRNTESIVNKALPRISVLWGLEK